MIASMEHGHADDEPLNTPPSDAPSASASADSTAPADSEIPRDLSDLFPLLRKVDAVGLSTESTRRPAGQLEPHIRSLPAGKPIIDIIQREGEVPPFLALIDEVGAIVSKAAIRLSQGVMGLLATIDDSSLEAANDALISIVQVLKRDEIWIRPNNLRQCESLDRVVSLAKDEGLPLSWIPRSDIVERLIAASNGQERAQILDSRFDDVLNDCNDALIDVEGELAKQCRYAIKALAEGFTAPAQSHAGNIIASTIDQWSKAKKLIGRESQHNGLEGGYFFSEYITFLPLPVAFTKWTRGDQAPSPDHFSRHATAHGVGRAGIFSKHHALTAIMLATSLTKQADFFAGEPLKSAEF